MPTAYAYLRYSSKAQGGDDKDSIDRQMASIRALTAQHGVDLLPENIYRDDGVSSFDGSNKKTGKLKDLIDLILNQSIKEGDIVFVESIDRLSRQKFRLSKDLVYSILDKGVILITTIDNRIYQRTEDSSKDFEQDLYLTLIAQRAHEESKTKSIRRKSAWNKAKQRAEDENKIFNGHNPPYGIIYNKELDRFEIDEEKANEIRFIFKSLQSVGVSNTIKKVNEFSIKKWTNKTIQILIDSKYPVGYYKAQKRDENKKKVFDRFIENYYPQIITFEEYNNAVSSMKNRSHRKHYGNQSVSSLNIFRHSLFCDECRATMFFETNKNQKGMKFSYYHCSRKKETRQGCDAKRLRFEHVLGLLFDAIEKTFEEYELVKDFTDEELKELENAIEQDLEKGKEFSKSILWMKQLAELLSGKNKKDDYNEKLKSLNNMLIKEKMKLENLNKSIDELGGSIPKIILQKIIETESNIEKYEIEINTIKNQNTQEALLNVSSVKDFIELVKSENGRIEINNFFIKNNISFFAGFSELEDSPFLEIHKDNQMIFWNFKKFDLHNPIKKYGFTKITDYE
ncbi:recombinase family protein [Pseudomonas aeruginosa]|nr:recombinase family protein [Pseudomonas aeruginosa]MCT1213476.1 recombinase family protein [Pseudomonas aeruginosa]